MSYKISYSEDASGNAVLRYSGDAQGLVDHCADYARAHRENGGVKNANGLGVGARKVLSLDPVVMMEIAHKHGLDYFDPAIYDIAMGRDYSKFRCIDDKLRFKTAGRKVGKIIVV